MDSLRASSSEPITSARNPLLKSIRKAVAQGGATDDGLWIAEGVHLVEEAVRSGLRVRTLLAAASCAHRIPRIGVRTETLDDSLFATLAATETSQGILALVEPPVWTEALLSAENPLFVVLDALQDPGNLGAIARSAEAFGASGMLLLRGSVDPANPKCLRASAGSLFRLPFLRNLDDAAIPQVRRFALIPGEVAQRPREADLRPPCALIIGNEGRGIRPELAASAAPIRIPTQGVESLNAAVAAAVILYEAQCQRGTGTTEAA